MSFVLFFFKEKNQTRPRGENGANGRTRRGLKRVGQDFNFGGAVQFFRGFSRKKRKRGKPPPPHLHDQRKRGKHDKKKPTGNVKKKLWWLPVMWAWRMRVSDDDDDAGAGVAGVGAAFGVALAMASAQTKRPGSGASLTKSKFQRCESWTT